MAQSKYLKQKGDIIYPYSIAKNILDLYPVGAIYLSTVNVNPSTYFGGTWEQIKDKFLLAAGDTYAGGTTGGEASHILTTSELPAHTHGSSTLTGYADFRAATGGADLIRARSGIVTTSKPNIGGDASYVGIAGSSGGVVHRLTVTATHEHTSVGSGTAHNNMPPYLTVYVWKRTA